MKLNELKKILGDCCNDLLFVYNGQNCGVTVEVQDYKPAYTMWYGEKEAVVHSVDEVISKKLFAGKSFEDIVDKLDIMVS